jgi:hypothetical protein
MRGKATTGPTGGETPGTEAVGGGAGNGDAAANANPDANANANAETPAQGTAPVDPSGGGASGGTASTVPPSVLAGMTKLMVERNATAAPDTSALNQKIVQAVQTTNAEVIGYAPSQIAIGPDMMISQAAGLVAQSAAAYFDGISKLTLASQGVLLKQMTEDLVKEDIKGAAEQAIGLLVTDVLLGIAAAVAAASGAMEAESAGFAIDKIDASIEKYADLLSKQGGK